MKILVTGATGFVGHTLVATLSKIGHEVVTAGFSSASAVDFRIPLSPTADWSTAVSGCDSVVHAGGLAHVLDRSAAADATAFDEINTAGTLNLAKAAVDAGVSQFIFISSIAALGDFGQAPARETDTPKPATPYGRSKLMAELGLAAMGAQTGLNVTCLRPPLVYGPDAGGRFAQMMAWCDRGLPLPFGNIDNQRSYLGIENLADAVRACLAAQASASGTFHIADAGSLSTPDLLRLIGTGLGKPARIFSVPRSMLGAMRLVGLAQPIDKLSQSLVLDTTSFRNRLDWTPPVAIKDGIVDAARRYSASRSQ